MPSFPKNTHRQLVAGRQSARKLLAGPFMFTGTMIEDLIKLVEKAEDQASVQDSMELAHNTITAIKGTDLKQWLTELGVSDSVLNTVFKQGFKVSITIEVPAKNSADGDIGKAS